MKWGLEKSFKNRSQCSHNKIINGRYLTFDREGKVLNNDSQVKQYTLRILNGWRFKVYYDSRNHLY